MREAAPSDAATDWVIPVSDTERARGVLAPESIQATCRALRARGVALLRPAFAGSLIDGLHQEYVTQFGALSARQMAERALAPAPNPFLEVGEKRYEIAPRMTGTFADPAVFANPLLRNLLPLLLGEDLRLSVFTVVVSFPGAPAQHIHRDHADLFPASRLGPVLPAYAINVAVPLVDVDLDTGPTGFWPGSHLWPGDRNPEPEAMTRIPFRRGDCVMLDYRTFHTGLPNKSGRIRPVLYMAYTRPWFSDEVNHTQRTSLNMALEAYLGLPESVRPMLLKVYTQAIRAKHVAAASG